MLGYTVAKIQWDGLLWRGDVVVVEQFNIPNRSFFSFLFFHQPPLEQVNIAVARSAFNENGVFCMENSKRWVGVGREDGYDSGIWSLGWLVLGWFVLLLSRRRQVDFCLVG